MDETEMALAVHYALGEYWRDSEFALVPLPASRMNPDRTSLTVSLGEAEWTVTIRRTRA